MTSSIEPIVRAVLYEGYALYPYRASSVKNRIRFPFGALHPAGTDGERSALRVEVPVEGAAARVKVAVRFLQLVERETSGWHEAIERAVAIDEVGVGAIAERGHERGFAFAAPEGVGGATVRGRVRLDAIATGERGWRLAVVVENAGEAGGLLAALASAHVVIEVRDGALVSLIDPPAALADVAAACRNEGVFPVLVGPEGTRETMLASPIVLYDHPWVAPESPGDLFDATEIDEILSLRVLTLTEAEKREARATDPRVARLIDRCEALGAEGLMRLHGVLRDAAGRPRVGERVRLRPRSGADALDLILAGKLATVVGVEQDVEGRTLLAVTIDEDPGKDLGELGQPGHRFFYGVAEVERA